MTEATGVRGPGPLPARLVRTLVAPGALAEELRREPRWLGPLLLGGVLVAAATALIPAEFWADMLRRQMLASSRPLPEGFDPEAMGRLQRTVGLVTGAVFWFLWAFAAAGVVTFLFGFVLGDDGRYVHYLSVVAHAFVIPALGALLTVPLRRAAGDPTLSLNLGLFVPLEDGYLAAFLGMLEIFFLWAWVVVGIGAARIDPRRGSGSALVLVLAVALVVAALLALVAPR